MRALLVLVLVGCGGSLPDSLSPQLALCLARAELRAESRANSECPLDRSFASCPSHDDIMAEFKAAQEECK